MTSSPRLFRGRASSFLVWCVAAVVVLLAFFLVLASGLPYPVRRTFSDAGLLLGGLVTALSCGQRIQRATGKKKRAWRLFALAGVAAAAGNTWVLFAHLRGLPDSVANYGNVGFAAAMVLAVAAFLVFPSVRRRGADLARILFDGTVIGGSLLSIVGITVFPQLLNQPGSAGGRTVSLAYCIFDVVVATLAAMLVVNGARDDRTVLLLLASGMLAYAVADLARGVLSAQGTFAYGGPVDIGWIAGYGLFALAARHHTATAPPQDDAPAAATPPLVSSSVTFGMFLVAALLRVLNPQAVVAGSTLLSVIWVLVLLCVTIRQALLILDNEALRHDLERRVQERTTELSNLTRTSQTMLNSVGDGIYGVDREGRITFANPSVHRMLGYDDQRLIGANAHDLFHAPQEDGTAFPYDSCYIAEAIRLGAVTTAEEDFYRRHDHSTIPVEVTASPLGEDGGVEGAVVVFRDTTQRREVDKMKSEFVSIVSHELRTPLTSIRGSLGLLSAGALGELTPAATRMVKIALDSSERLTRLINDILDIERIESGTMPMQMSRQRADDLVRQAVEQMQTLAQQSRVRLMTGTLEGEIWADPDRIVQTLVNLIGNAVKFSEPQSIVDLEARLQGRRVVFTVRDQGRGIPPDKIDAVFKRFEQVDSSDAREKGGSGLGLAISRSIVERHDGEIWVDSVFGEGSQFSFSIPAVEERRSSAAGLAPGSGTGLDQPAANGQRPDADVAGIRSSTSGTAKTVLVCDDDADFVEVMCTVMQRRGYRALGVTDGEEAIRLATEVLPDAILLDLMMEGRSGGDVIRALRAQEATRAIPLLIVSGLDPSSDAGLVDLADDWLVKPVDEDRLIRSLNVSIADQEIHGRVLVVEDDDAVATMVSTMLRRRGLVVDHARTVGEALTIAKGTQPTAVILDVELPDGRGSDLVEAMQREQGLAEMPTVLFSASGGPETGNPTETAFLRTGAANPQSLEARMIELVDHATGRTRPTTDDGTRPSETAITL